MMKIWSDPSAGEAKATVWPSGERTAPFMGLFQWLIWATFAGPLDEPRRKKAATPPSTRRNRKAAAPMYRIRGDFSSFAAIVPLVADDWTKSPALCEAVMTRPELVSRFERFRSLRNSAADW